MKYVTASTLTYDAAVGRVEPGQRYFIEDDKAERWINSGIATEAPPKPPDPQPEPTPEPEPGPTPPEPEPEEDEDEDKPAEDDEQLRAEVHKLSEEGDSQRTIAEKLDISRDRVRRFLAT